MKSYTIDASVALKWLSAKDERDLKVAKDLFIKAANREIVLSSPTLLKAEVTNILLKKKKLTVKDTREALSIINKTNLYYVELSDSLMKEAIRQAEKYDLSVYGGIYVACSNFSKSSLISADKKGHGKLKNVVLLSDLSL